MLIRLISHSRNNPKSIDKLICIKGLPDDWMFIRSPEGTELKRPWKADIDKNIPHDIRQFCDPMQMLFRYPPVEKGAKEIKESRLVLGVILDYMTEPGREMWEQIERFLEGTIPRTERVPSPVLCAKDEHSPFQTYAPSRNSTGSLELREADVPIVDVRPYLKQAAPVIPVEDTPTLSSIVEPVDVQPEFKCDECSRSYVFEKVLKKHKKTAHKKEKVVA